jgi:hypothetical protein
MESYLSSQGVGLISPNDSSFSSYLRNEESVEQKPSSEITVDETNSTTEVIYDEKDCPRVEVVSVDGNPQKILIHLLDSKLLEINCHY